jgi:hypothetical protein
VIDGAALAFACQLISTGWVVSGSHPILLLSDQLQQQQHGVCNAPEEQVQSNSRQKAKRRQRLALFAWRSECTSAWAIVRLSSMEVNY